MKLSATTSSSKRGDRDKAPEVKTANVEPSSTPVRLPALVRPATVGDFGRRVALVIGNGKYEHVPTLPNATSDAEALAKALEETGFQSVTLKTNLTRDQMNSALAEFSKLADAADWAAVYYSGHGIESRGANYMIPIDAELKVDRDVELETVEVTKVLSAIEGARKIKLIILDACRDNPFLEQMKRTVATRSITRGLAPIEADAGVLIVYAAKHGETALDGDDNHSPFATALINRIRIPNLEIRRLFDLVRDDVLATTGRRQQPFTYGSVSGSEDFFFQTKQP
ncbi:MAG TPA: caspase family protein [Candidatus Saccharimonadales bacterium]|nr:caspase family protein [Candidatus Saccharimonadales bacterium]